MPFDPRNVSQKLKKRPKECFPKAKKNKGKSIMWPNVLANSTISFKRYQIRTILRHTINKFNKKVLDLLIAWKI